MVSWLIKQVVNAVLSVVLALIQLVKGAAMGVVWMVKTLVLGLVSLVLGSLKCLKFVVQMMAQGAEGLKELGSLADPWIRTYWTIAALLYAGFTIFQTAVIHSIRSTPHPELVYTIFVIASLTCVLVGVELYRYQRDARLAKQLLAMSLEEREAYVAELKEGDFKPMLALMVKPIGNTLVEQRELVETELLACEDHSISRLNLPTYLSGSLIGIGLVGTFVGLLAALTDLGGVFSALMGGGMGSKDSDPMALFAGMLVKLQEPMKGMATAFVASLYGLLGSLVLGLVIYSVRKTAGQSFASMRDLMRDHSRQLASLQAEQIAKPESAERIAHATEVLSKQQQVLELLLTELITGSKKSQPKTHVDSHPEGEQS